MPLGLETEDLESLLEYICAERGFDFTGYERPALHRRIETRMHDVQSGSYDAYRTYLEANPSELAQLLDTIVANVTTFFDDPPSWDYLRRDVIPRIVDESRSSDAISVWSTGCASGEDAYSLAICFAEALPEGELGTRVKIHATDVNTRALVEGRDATYTAAKIENVPPDLRERYLDEHDGRWVVAAPLRRAVMLGPHDVVHDPPISRIDLLASRHELLYLTPDTQQRILANFYFALQPAGYLFLARPGPVLGAPALFAPVDRNRRIFRKVPRPEPAREIVRSSVDELQLTTAELQSARKELEATSDELRSTNEELASMNDELQSASEQLETIDNELTLRIEDLDEKSVVLESVLAGLDAAVAILDPELRVASWNRAAGELWGLLADDVQGRHFMNLEFGLPLDRLRPALRAALGGEAGAPVVVDATDRHGRGISCRVRIAPIAAGGDAGPRGLIVFMNAGTNP